MNQVQDTRQANAAKAVRTYKAGMRVLDHFNPFDDPDLFGDWTEERTLAPENVPVVEEGAL